MAEQQQQATGSGKLWVNTAVNTDRSNTGEGGARGVGMGGSNNCIEIPPPPPQKKKKKKKKIRRRRSTDNLYKK